MLDLNLLLVFEAILLHQNVTAAAAHNGLTQSAMSNALGRLRRHFDDPLFVSTRNGMLPTPRALDLARPLMQALSLVRASAQTAKDFDPQQSKRTFRFHMTDVGEMVFLPPLVKRLDEMGATVKLETAQLASTEVAERLESGEIDFAAGYLPSLSKSVENAPLFREHYVCMTRRSHPIARNGGLTVEKFLAASHVLIESMGSGHKNIERKLNEQGIKRECALRVPHFLVIPMIVANTDRIVTIPSRVANAFSTLVQTRIHPLPVMIPSFDVSLFWHPRFRDDPPLRWLRNLMIELFQESRKGKEARA
ncbi:MAG TPA: LysR family transcriptional regulator [Rhodanobacteraceae bacterium]|nr:LysR family transcriptional regulator [Rhodanobacteraceae bacterium]